MCTRPTTAWCIGLRAAAPCGRAAALLACMACMQVGRSVRWSPTASRRWGPRSATRCRSRVQAAPAAAAVARAVAAHSAAEDSRAIRAVPAVGAVARGRCPRTFLRGHEKVGAAAPTFCLYPLEHLPLFCQGAKKCQKSQSSSSVSSALPITYELPEPEKKSWFSSAFGESAARMAGFTSHASDGNSAG